MAGDRHGERVLPLWDHVTELAKLLRLWVYTFVIATIVFMVLPADLSFLNDPLAFYKPMISVVLLGIKDYLLPQSVVLISGSFTAPIEIYFMSSIVLGFAVSVPVLAYEIYRFVDPALLPHEKRAVLPFVTGFSLLFLAGTDLEYVINPYEEYALEQAVQLKEKHGGEVTVVTLGPEKSTQVILKTLALGADKAIHLKHENFPNEPSAVAHAIADELRTIEFDALFFGKKGVDDDNQQVGQMVAELLGIPCVTQIARVDILNGKAVAHREVEGGTLVVETTLPAAFTGEKDLAIPRYASLRELVAARKKPITMKEPAVGRLVLETVMVQYPPQRPPGRIVGKGTEAVPVLVKLLHEEAKVI